MSSSTSTIQRTTSQTAVAGSFSSLALHPATTNALKRMGITEPTPIQAAALPVLLQGRDVIGQARTGSGKTLAFVIPVLQLVDPARNAVQVLVLTPTRELAVQIEQVLSEVAQGRGVSSALIFGGRAVGPQIAALRRGAQVVIGTPGRVLDLLNQGVLKLDRVRFLVLDEADEMLDRGFAPDVERILAHTPRDRQTALFSATLPDWVSSTAHKHLNRPVTVAVDQGQRDVPPITHVAYDLPDDDKLTVLRELLDLRGDGSIIVFGRTKHGVKKLARKLEQDGYPVAALQGNLSQNARDEVMRRFRSGEVQILVATNVAARGLDITSVEQVINLDLPESPELLTHRIGRTGRMGREGRAITLLAPQDSAKWRELQRAQAHRIPRVAWRGAEAALGLTSHARITTQASRPPTRPTPERGSGRPAASSSNRGARTAERAPRSTVHSTVTPRPRRGRDDGPMIMTWADGRPLDAMPSQPNTQTQGRSERTSIVCSSCGTPAEVPFRPDPTRPVYCSDCHRSRKSRRAASAA